MNKNYIILFILIIIPIAINPYPWPIQPFNTQHPITATFGEYRPPYGSLGKHFHWGVDIGESAGTNVYPVDNGYVKRWSNKENGWIVVGDFRYVHINLNDLILDTTRICTTSVTLLGKIGNINNPHLHFAEGMGGISNRVNPLRTGGLTPYADSAMPAVYGGNNYRFYRHGENNIITSPLYGKVDILTKAKDAQSNGSNIVGVYRIGYQVNDEEGNTILPYTENIKFDNVNGILDSIYGSESDISNYYYWVTNALSANNCYRYWNTKLRKGQAWNGDDADFNSEAKYPDGEYNIIVNA